MPTLIDSFLVTFGLDTRDYDSGAARIREQNKKNREDARKTGGGLEDANKKAGVSFGKLRNEVVGLVAAFTGGVATKTFIQQIIAGDAATGRLAANLGVATSELSAWQQVARQAGGSAEDANAAFSLLGRAFQSLRTTGETGLQDDFKGLNISKADLEDPARALLKLAEAGEKMDRGQFFFRLSRMGIPASVIFTLQQGREETERLLEAAQKNGTATDKSAEAAQRFEAALASLKDRLVGSLRPAIAGILEGLVSFIDKTDAMTIAVPIITGLMGALAVATIAATWPWLALAAGIGAAAYAINKWRNGSTGKAYLDSEQNILPAWLTRMLKGEKAPDLSAPAAAPAASGPRDGRPVMKPAGQRAVALDGNNPGGINDGDYARGLAGYVGANGRYAAFATMEDGLNAQRKLIASYVTRGYNTPNRIARRYAPAGDGNDPDAYARNIARRMGIDVNDPIKAGQIEAFVQAQARAENVRFGARAGAAGARPGANIPRTGGGAGSSTTTASTTIGQITVYTPGTDAAGIARDLPAAIAKRNLALQAATGLDG